MRPFGWPVRKGATPVLAPTRRAFCLSGEFADGRADALPRRACPVEAVAGIRREHRLEVEVAVRVALDGERQRARTCGQSKTIRLPTIPYDPISPSVGSLRVPAGSISHFPSVSVIWLTLPMSSSSGRAPAAIALAFKTTVAGQSKIRRGRIRPVWALLCSRVARYAAVDASRCRCASATDARYRPPMDGS